MVAARGSWADHQDEGSSWWGLHLGAGMSGNIRTGNGETQLTQDHPTLRRRLGVVAGLLGALAVTVAVHPAEAARHASHHASHASHPSHEGSRTTHEGSGGPPYAAIVLS